MPVRLFSKFEKVEIIINLFILGNLRTYQEEYAFGLVGIPNNCYTYSNNYQRVLEKIRNMDFIDFDVDHADMLVLPRLSRLFQYINILEVFFNPFQVWLILMFTVCMTFIGVFGYAIIWTWESAVRTYRELMNPESRTARTIFVFLSFIICASIVIHDILNILYKEGTLYF
ncbi:hypothetical protein CEXT_569171 [Caerostris extrusa]|uniref:Uncharacterized protein n=1 Tax=Caerostris extrusa TaxID=172846 RepID=A0AAV4TXG1_CAEEX|nr:hypothetical protein CEXT_569171 [Caerostris extrusa]